MRSPHRAGSLEAIGQGPDTGDGNRHFVAGLKEAWRIESDSNPGGRARRDDVSGLQREAGRDRRHEGGNVEDEGISVADGILSSVSFRLISPVFRLYIVGRELLALG